MQRCLGTFLLLILFIGCKEGPPKGVLKKDVMTNVLYEIHLSEGYLFTSAVDSMRQKTADFNEGIYRHYQTDSATVRQSLEYYASRPQILQSIYNDIGARLKTLDEEMRAAENDRYRSVFVADSIKRAAIADSLRRIELDSIKRENRKNLLYWKSPDSTSLKPKPWTWENSSRLPLLKDEVLEIYPDTLKADTSMKPMSRPVPTLE